MCAPILPAVRPFPRTAPTTSAPAHAIRCVCRPSHSRLRGAPRSLLPPWHAPCVPGVLRCHQRLGGEQTRHVLPSSRTLNERIHSRPGAPTPRHPAPVAPDPQPPAASARRPAHRAGGRHDHACPCAGEARCRAPLPIPRHPIRHRPQMTANGGGSVVERPPVAHHPPRRQAHPQLAVVLVQGSSLPFFVALVPCHVQASHWSVSVSHGGPG